MCRDRHKRLSLIGEYTANKTLKSLKTCLKFAKKARGYPIDNPVDAVSLHSVGLDEGGNEKHIPLDEIRGWYGRLGEIPNQLRRLMHEIGLYTALRPANLMGCQKAWLDFNRHCLSIPARYMKGRRLFNMPMSPHIESLFRRALELSEKFGPSPWVFPTYSRDGLLIAVQENKEDLLPQETGYVLRHTYSNLARLAQVPDGERDALLAHKKPGITGVYIDEAYALPVLILLQQRVTDFIQRVLETTEPLDAIVANVANQSLQPAQAQVNTDRLLDAKGLADMLGLSLEEVERMKRQGAPYVDVVGQIRYQFSEVLTWLRSTNKHLRAVQ
jgi:integrase